MSTKFHDPSASAFVQGCGHMSHTVKIYYFIKHFLFYTQSNIKQTESDLMLTKEGYIKIVNDPWGRGSYAGTLPYESYSENVMFRFFFLT